MTIIQSGDQVRFTHGPLGCIAMPAASRFIGNVQAGETGIYVGEHPTLQEDGWHLVEVTLNGETAYCPVHSSMIEKVEARASRK